MTPAPRFLPKTGEIYRMKIYVGDRLKPKNPGDTSRNKYFIITGVEADSVSVVSVYINSEINRKKYDKIKNYQLKIWRDDYDFLTREYSFVDCTRLTVIDTSELAHIATFVGNVRDDDLAEIIRNVKSVPWQSRHVLRQYGLLADEDTDE